MADDNNAQAHRQPPEPPPDLKDLDRLVGTWELSGEVRGTVTYEWMEGGYFLIQRVDLEQHGQKIWGIEIIGHEREFGAERGDKEPLLLQHGRHPRLRLRAGRGHPNDLGRREGVPGVLQGHVRRRRRHAQRRLALPGGRRLRGYLDQGRVGRTAWLGKDTDNETIRRKPDGRRYG